MTKTLNAETLGKIRHRVRLDQKSFATLGNVAYDAVIKFENDSAVSESAKTPLAEVLLLLPALNEIMETEHIATWLQSPNHNYRNEFPLNRIAEALNDIV